MEKLKKFLKKKTNWITVFTLALALTGLCISFIFPQLSEPFSFQIIAMMFLLLAVENFIKQFTYMEDIKEKLDGLKLQSSDYVKLKEAFDSHADILPIIQRAHNEIFISGMNMDSWGGLVKNALQQRQSDLTKIRILVLNLDNNELRKTYDDMRGDSLKGIPTAKYFLETFSGYNIEIKTVNVIMPTIFFAADINHADGYILAIPLSNTSDDNELPHIELTPANKQWYDTYHNQIEQLWEKGEYWKPS